MLASLGSATHTRVDSAAKHIRQCKVNEWLMGVWLDKDAETMHRQKNAYATMKDELVLNVNESLGKACRPSEAYPSVVSNFTSLALKTQTLLTTWYAHKTPPDFFEYQRKIQTKDASLADLILNNKQVDTIPFFRAQGYALGRAEGNMRSGDTVFSVMIGGQITVTNGNFPMRPGQMVQWYFEFEDAEFDKDGRRNRQLAGRVKNAGQKRAHDEINAECRSRALPKPYVLAKDGTEHYGDKIRIFAKCICGGPANHKVDIMLMTQSL
jgi:hypothetical protein